MKKAPKKSWGFDTSDLDTSIRPQDDFFNYASGGWFKKNPIPESESRWGSFTILRFEGEKRLKKIVLEVAGKKKLEHGSPEQMIRDFYLSGMNTQLRTKLGLKPIQKWMQLIQNISSLKDLHACIAELQRLGVGVVWGFGVDQDSKNSEKYLLHIGQSGLGMPDRDYYLKDDAESVRIRTAYIQHVAKVLRYADMTPSEAKRATEIVMKIETELANVSMTKEDLRDPEKTYNKKSVAQLTRHTPKLCWESYLKKIGAGKVLEVDLMQPDYFKAVERLLEEIPLDEWKTYLTWHLISDFSGYLMPALIRENFAYGKVLTGAKKMKSLWRQVLGAVNGNLGEQLGKLYVERYFSPESKEKVNRIVDDLFTAYEARIKKLDWMDDSTKKKALKKLRMMERKLGYPDRWKKFTGLRIQPNDYVGNAIRTGELEHAREMRKLMKPVDRKEWFMDPQTVNAYCNYGMNEIVFPAAILQGVFFNPDADDAINYGAIGSVIGHEITHGFDDQGSKFDGAGNMRTWWKESDRVQFDKKARVTKYQFDEYEVEDGVKVNGQLTLGENIADLGGVSIAYDAYKLQLARTGRVDIEGFTPEQRFFLGYAATEREAERPEFRKLSVLTDPHAPGIFRVNGPLSNLPEFYEAFNVQPGDTLYRKPSDIAKIW